jgi:hypothetical protein
LLGEVIRRLKRKIFKIGGFIYFLKYSEILIKNAVMLNNAVKAAASKDCSGKPFLCAGKMQGGKKLVAKSPIPMLIEILVMMLLIKLFQ